MNLGEFSSSTKLESISKEELITKFTVLESEYLRALKEIYKLKYENLSDEQLKLIMQEQMGSLNEALYGASSERYKKPEKKKKENTPPKPRVKKPSERYPNIPVNTVIIGMDPVPSCTSCGEVMTDSGMTEESEQLTVIPKKYEINRQLRIKYRCTCQSCILTAPAPLRITPGSSYSDEMVTDVVLSKYCDLIPIERYAAMAGRSGLIDLPPHSLIEVTHQFADFVWPVYALIKKWILGARVLHADETPHRMLEGSDKKSWYLWGFSTKNHCFLECHDSRSGDVASEILLNAECEVLVSDVYAGYGKAIKAANEIRKSSAKNLIQNANCHAHARRYFYKTWPNYPEAKFYLDHYHEIYRLNAESKGQPPPEILKLRLQMKERFLQMEVRAMQELAQYPVAGKYGKALRYFLENYRGLMLFLTDPEVPIDNNLQERLLRNHVVGRKTWYGTHSKRGAQTAAILFSLVETCKLNHVNPREYFKKIVEDLLAGKPPYTPAEFNKTGSS